ncbi:MarR family winged helix-turn-helix transcriptional regulator [Phreatobacter oligotrophus]|uniref:DNA-binding MarR family transcriptional regulator n=1 Tax=Phreatobacter oligotrophus TaxID=1122261 RepID=A0A2T4YY88_9HYPH|nr:MarR family transcriptional regulator [Phreatobacter oligotrophus]PTM51493.1 DNA-binding MarR family transcriptional regulator [Phreatobacter oligotrophus]
MLERSLTYLLSSIVEDGIGSANRIFEIRIGLSVRELRVLRLVRANPGITFTVLAERTKFERTLTSRTVSKLIKAGFIERSAIPSDARAFGLTITPDGVALCERADPLTAEFETLMLAPLSMAEREAFLSAVERLKVWIEGGYAGEVANRYPRARAGAKPFNRTRDFVGK